MSADMGPGASDEVMPPVSPAVSPAASPAIAPQVAPPSVPASVRALPQPELPHFLDDPAIPELHRRIVAFAHADIGEGEDPPGSNRGRYPDLVNQEFGSPLGSYWCANSTAHNWRKAGAPELPPIPGLCESWHQWARRTGRFTLEPAPGRAVLYSADGKRADHIGTIERVVRDPEAPKGRRVVTIEGNTSLAQYDRNGWIIDQKPENTPRVLGYIDPLPLT
jgi:hypothetical protein